MCDESRDDFRPTARPGVYGSDGPACKALLAVMLRRRDETARRRESRDAVRVREQWTSDQNRGPENDFFTALAYAADPVGSVAMASRGKDPAVGIIDRIRAVSLSDERVWGWAARASPGVHRSRPVSSRGPRVRELVSEGLEMLRGARAPQVAGYLRDGRPGLGGAGAQLGGVEAGEGGARAVSAAGASLRAVLVAAAACACMETGLVVVGEGGMPLPVVLDGETARVAWVAPDQAGTSMLSAGSALARIGEKVSGADSTWSVSALRAALVAADVPRPHPRRKEEMARAASDAGQLLICEAGKRAP